LLTVAVDSTTGLGPDDASTVRLRRLLEADEFGVVAHVLATTDNCTAESCARLALLKEPARVRENLAAKTFEGLIEKHSQDWAGAQKRNGDGEAAAGGAASLSVGAVEQPTVQPGAPTLWAVPQAGDSAAPPPAPVAAPATGGPAAVTPPRPSAPAPRPTGSAAAPSGSGGASAPPSSAPRPSGNTSGSSTAAGGATSTASGASPRPPAQVPAPPPVRAGGLPPPQSLAPPPGTPPAPGVPARVN
jgi:hypothetical protein